MLAVTARCQDGRCWPTVTVAAAGGGGPSADGGHQQRAADGRQQRHHHGVCAADGTGCRAGARRPTESVERLSDRPTRPTAVNNNTTGRRPWRLWHASVSIAGINRLPPFRQDSSQYQRVNNAHQHGYDRWLHEKLFMTLIPNILPKS